MFSLAEPVDTLGCFGHDAHDAAEHLLGSGPGKHLVELFDSVNSADRLSGADGRESGVRRCPCRPRAVCGALLRASAWLATGARR